MQLLRYVSGDSLAFLSIVENHREEISVNLNTFSFSIIQHMHILNFYLCS